MMKLWAWLLRRRGDFENSEGKQGQPHYVENISEYGRASWVAADDPAGRCIDGGPHKCSLEGVINPFAYTDKHGAEGQQQGMGIGDALNVERQAGHNPRCTKCNKEMIPVLYLKPGLRFTHLGNLPML